MIHFLTTSNQEMQAHLKMLTFHLMLTKTALCGWVWIKSAQFSKVLVSLVLQTFSFLFLRPIFLRWQIIIFHELKGRTMFFHWKGKVRLSPPPSYVIRPGKSWENFNSKFSANLDFKEFELLSLNWQPVYIPWKIKGARKKSSLIWISRGSFCCHICFWTHNGYARKADKMADRMGNWTWMWRFVFQLKTKDNISDHNF